MKRDATFFLSLLLFSVLSLTSCAPEAAVPVCQDHLTAKEEEWLAKAYRTDRNGWIFLHIEGKPFERGFQRGYLTASEIDEFLKTTAYIQKFNTAKELDFFVEAAAKLFRKKVSKEYIEEMKGMVAGMNKAGKSVTFDEMLFMNGFIDIWYWWPKEKEETEPGCSAFIATADATADGKIVMAHNSWASYASIRFCNTIVDILPEKGHPILMQSWGPCI
ncbi:MAG: C45 family peptidase, partial [Planctomycetota bacterium]